MHCVQHAFWFDTSEKKPQGFLLHNSLKPILIGHWVSSGIVDEGSCNFSTNASNVFPSKGESADIIPVGIASALVRMFSFEGQWILDLTRSSGAGLQAGLSANRNVVCLEEDDIKLRKSAAETTAAAAAEVAEKGEDEAENLDSAEEEAD